MSKDNDVESCCEVFKELKQENVVSEKDKKEVMVLLMALHIGANLNKIIKKLPYSKKSIEQIYNRCVKSGIFKHGKVYCGDWFNKKTGTISFCMDVCVAKGLAKRVE